MAKARKAKKAPARKAASKRAAGATKTVSVSSSFNPHSELAKLKAEKEAQEKRIAEQRAAILAKGIEVTEAALERAIAARDQAQNRVDALQQELHGLKVEAGLARGAAAKGKGRRGRPAKSAAAPKATASKRGRKPGAGRKPRVEAAVKQAAVADTLKKYPSGVLFSALKKELSKQKTSGGATIFGTADFNSSATFSSKLLPKGYKIQGSHRAAKVVKK